MDCIFCKIVNKEIPSNFVYENDDVIAINDLSLSKYATSSSDIISTPLFFNFK